MDVITFKEIIRRYKEGIASEQDLLAIEQWFRETGELPYELTPEREKIIEGKLLPRLAAITEKSKHTATPQKYILHSLPKRYMRAAAIFLLVIGTVYYLLRHSKHSSISYTIVASAPGQQRFYVLPDSSRVYLFPNSSLELPDNYGRGSREIILKGRGFFEVQEDAATPFYVHAGSLHTKVLGTSFEVNTVDTARVSVIVRTGKVAVQYQGRDLAVLTPDKRLQYDVLGQDVRIDSVNASYLCGWKSGELAFQQAPLPDALRAISDWYNVPIHIENSQWLSEAVTIRFKNQTIQEVMDLLSKTIGFQYRRDQRGIIIY